MVSSDNTTNQVNSYYPFGMHAEKYEQLDNKYLYNGKEFQDDTIGNGQLEWYDYGARFYDAALDRFHSVDPLTEKNHHDYSPYAYVYNNPLRFIDPLGQDTVEIQRGSGELKNHIETDKGNDVFFMVDKNGDRIEGQSASFEEGTLKVVRKATVHVKRADQEKEEDKNLFLMEIRMLQSFLNFLQIKKILNGLMLRLEPAIQTKILLEPATMKGQQR